MFFGGTGERLLGGCSLFMSLAKIDFNINWKKLIFLRRYWAGERSSEKS